MAIHSTANSWQSFCCARLKTTIPAQSINKTSVSCEVCCYKTMKTLAWFTNITTNTKNLPHPVCSLRWLRSHLQPVLRSHWNRHTHETQSQNIIIHVWTSKDVEGSLGVCVCVCVSVFECYIWFSHEYVSAFLRVSFTFCCVFGFMVYMSVCMCVSVLHSISACARVS